VRERTNEQWLAELRGPERDRALADLRVVLVRGLKVALAGRVRQGLNEAAEDFAQEALIKILAGLVPSEARANSPPGRRKSPC